MKQVTQHNKTGEIRIESLPISALKAGHVLVKVRYSLISAGTEKASISQRKASLLEKAKKNPELVKKVLDQVRLYGLVQTYRRVKTQLETRASLGYSASGVVIALGEGLTEFKVGDRVACAGAGYASHAEYILIPANLCCKVPKAVDLDEAAYTTVGGIALQGVRQAEPTLGETIAVIGLGLVGQLTVQLLKANGCTVIGIDPDQGSVKLAKECGADAALHRNNGDVKNVVRSMTKGAGVDAVIITAATPSNDPVELAGDLCREKGRVVLVGDVGLTLPRAPYFLKELDFRLSRSIGPGRYDPIYEERGHDYPLGYVRWSENRNMQEFLRNVSTGAIDVRRLTTHRFVIDDAKSAYSLISARGESKERYIGILLDYGEGEGRHDAREARRIELPRTSVVETPAKVKIGFVGAGNFAQGFLLPHLRQDSSVSLVGVCTANGLNAANVARNFGFGFATTEAREVLENETMNTVFIATRHNLHARLALEALRAGKNVFVEKPLALTRDELKELQAFHRSGRKEGSRPILLVGFNRRFAPHTQQVARFFEEAVGPFVLNYRVNAGLMPATHWTRDPKEGGGRIIGEICHFVDLLQYCTQARPVKVFAEPLSPARGVKDDDSVVVTIKFDDGSVGTITYLANGDVSLPKERLELSSTGRSAVMDNFQHLTLYQQGKKREFKFSNIQKGHKEEIRAFLQAIVNGQPSPVSFENLALTTLTTFAIEDSLRLGAPVHL
jgi:polar amino acid transport system substrate-binding protein